MAETTVGEYLLERLKQLGVDDIFGVPGDFVIPFMKQITPDKNIRLINTCNELNAAYAADGYARIKGLGVVCTTFGVGELSAINGIAGSYAERIPVLAITGSPSVDAQKNKKMLHHTCGPYETQISMFEKITVYCVTLFDAKDAPMHIDRALTKCISLKRPVYLSIPADITHKKCRWPEGKLTPEIPTSDANLLKEAVDAAAKKINSAKLPVILADAQITRYDLQNEFKELLSTSGLPYSCLMMGKTLIDEDHPQFIGLFMGDRSRKYVFERMNKADVVLEVGLVMSDLNTGGFTIDFKKEKEICVEYDSVRVGSKTYEKVLMKDFLLELAKKVHKRDPATLEVHKATEGCTHRRGENFKPEAEKALTASRFFDRMAHFIPENAVVLADTGLSMFGVAEVLMPKGVTWIGQVFYGSIGYALGAALGVAAASPRRPVVLFIGDGAFQVVAQDLSSFYRFKLNATIFLVNNDGYTIERLIDDGTFNDIQPWKYHQLTQVFGGEVGDDVFKEGELEEVLKRVEKQREKVNFIEIHLDRWDCTEPLRKAGQSMQAQGE